MGQAKIRGSYEQRRSEAILREQDRQNAEQEARRKAEANMTTVERERRRKVQTTCAFMMAIAHSTIEDRRPGTTE